MSEYIPPNSELMNRVYYPEPSYYYRDFVPMKPVGNKCDVHIKDFANCFTNINNSTDSCSKFVSSYKSCTETLSKD